MLAPFSHLSAHLSGQSLRCHCHATLELELPLSSPLLRPCLSGSFALQNLAVKRISQVKHRAQHLLQQAMVPLQRTMLHFQQAMVPHELIMAVHQEVMVPFQQAMLPLQLVATAGPQPRPLLYPPHGLALPLSARLHQGHSMVVRPSFRRSCSSQYQLPPLVCSH